jgi:hypothetical protein
MGSKMLDLLLDIAPGINRVAMMFNPDTAPGGGKYYLGDFEAAARSSKVAPITARAQSDAEIEAVVTSLGREPDGGLVVMPDLFMLNHVRPILLQAARNNVPTIYPWRYVVTKEGGLISYGPDFRDIVRRAAPLRRSHSSGGQARRFTGSSAGEIRDGSERQDSQGARAYCASVASIAGRRSDRMRQRDFGYGSKAQF